MKLNEAGKNEVRKLIEDQVKNVPDGQRLKLKKEILEDLIFYTVHYRERGKITDTIKYPVWTGPFLRKIDLSELSFDDVVWSYDTFEGYLEDMDIKYDHVSLEKKNIDFSSTNANINASINIRNNSTLQCIDNCNFEGMDLSNIVLYLHDFCCDIGDGNNFKNTGIRIITENKVINSKVGYLGEEIVTAEKRLYEFIEEHVFDGCYIDGHLIQDGKVIERQATDRKEKLLSEYEQYKKDYLASIMEQVEAQASIFEEEHKEAKHRK